MHGLPDCGKQEKDNGVAKGACNALMTAPALATAAEKLNEY